MIINFDPPEPIGLNEDPWGIAGFYPPTDWVKIGNKKGAHTAPNAMSLTGAGAFHPGVETSAWRALPELVLGVPYRLSLWVNGDEAVENTPLSVVVNTYGGHGTPDVISLAISKASLSPGWNLVVVGSFIADGSAPAWNMLEFQLFPPPGPGAFASGTWVVDTIEFEDTSGQGGEHMAVMLAEFGIRAALSMVIADLNNEIGYVESEAALGLDLPRFSTWRSYDSGQASPDEVEFEIFEIGDVTFPHERYDQSTWRSGQRTRVSCTIPLRAAINHANRGNAYRGVVNPSPGFELWSAGVPTGWAFGDGTGTITVTQDATDPYPGGLYSAKMVRTNASNPGGLTIARTGFIPGKYYKVEFAQRQTSGAGATALRCRLRNFTAGKTCVSDGVTWSASPANDIVGPSAGTTGWTLYTKTVRIDPSFSLSDTIEVALIPYFNVSPDGVWYDAVDIRGPFDNATDDGDRTLYASQMAERSRLYGAALVRTFRNKPDCSYSKFITIVPKALRYNVKDGSRVGESLASLSRVEFDFDMHLQEEPTGEQASNGAYLPSVTQENP